jgi:two-component system LytT family response regulator
MIEKQRIALNTIDAVHFIRLKDILYCKSENSYTTFHLTNQEPIVVSKNIKEFENQLNKSHFFRSHQSYLVNLEHVTKIDKHNGFILLLTDKSEIPTSIRKRKGLLQIIQNE